MSKIVVLVRTRNEAERIGAFCRAYKDADHIIVSDGGSQDRTVEIASTFPNVILSPFNERVQLGNGLWRNNDAQHVDHLIAEAKKLDPSWIILDDCDCVPNRELKANYRRLLEETTAEYVHVVRFYFWEKRHYFPRMSSPGGELEPSLWAWRGNIDFKMIDIPPAYEFSVDGRKVESLRTASPNLDLYPPYALLHYSWDERRVKHKVKAYRKSGFIPEYSDPRKWAGEMLPKTDWMVE